MTDDDTIPIDGGVYHLDALRLGLALGRRVKGETTVLTVEMPTLTAAYLVAGHVHDLWDSWVSDEDRPGCCNRCCEPCKALKDLLDRGMLDTLYEVYEKHMRPGGGDYSEDSDVWDTRNQQVNRKLLTEAWGIPCNSGCDGEDNR